MNETALWLACMMLFTCVKARVNHRDADPRLGGARTVFPRSDDDTLVINNLLDLEVVERQTN